MEIKNKKNILVPFVGFYESIASEKAEDIAFHDYIAEKDIKDNPETGWMDKPEDMTEAEQEDFWDNYYPAKIGEIREQVAKDYIEHLGGELGLNFEFESISSPRYYNYTTDRLFVNADGNELIHFYNRVDQDVLKKMIAERHTSRPGFDSFYENDINDPSWQDPAQFDHNQWETVIDAYVEQNGIEIDNLYYI